ncbi:uncharacterized protein L969DRAFT_90153 [Mixia osmundae IAM 14324]|uniref:Uncharacterized protein n=1 Tax=Mixia osmundae (strain CBS 9802 / IAM 14324 / JCM 22182 / KY 12970) TaxID=764103 RepID=G7DSX1_MIXOS|nr:uncharacterized protein L969DRAFT_90153 [Mixia osmundae IAM 14324]KEI37095.1 hypothetical protein L969DRAFT_90153 [Mixia osmundae IAM 14324]GAA93681.1 hypothetical protein E5Q_00326 [Mixia osmundae IAM 14324]
MFKRLSQLSLNDSRPPLNSPYLQPAQSRSADFYASSLTRHVDCFSSPATYDGYFPLQASSASSQPPPLTNRSRRNSSVVGVPAQSTDRADLQQTLLATENVRHAMREYAVLLSQVTRAEAAISKSLRRLADTIDKDNSPAPTEALLSVAKLYEGLSEVDTRASKRTTAELRSMDDICDGLYKDITKSDKAHTSNLEQLNDRARANQVSYDRSMRSASGNTHPSQSSMPSHELVSSHASAHQRYIQNLTQIDQAFTFCRDGHGQQLSRRKSSLARQIAKGSCAMASLDWSRMLDETALAADEIGRIARLGSVCQARDLPEVPLLERPPTMERSNSDLKPASTTSTDEFQTVSSGSSVDALM